MVHKHLHTYIKTCNFKNLEEIPEVIKIKKKKFIENPQTKLSACTPRPSGTYCM
jgi:hypothetical protein